MSSVSIVANKVTLKLIVNMTILETMVSLGIIHSECPSLLNYSEGVAKAGIRLMNVGQQGIFKEIETRKV